MRKSSNISKIKVVVVVVVVSTGRPTGITPYPTMEVLSDLSSVRRHWHFRTVSYFLMVLLFTCTSWARPHPLSLLQGQEWYNRVDEPAWTSQTGEAIRIMWLPFDSISHIVPIFWAV